MRLKTLSDRRLKQVSTKFRRYLHDKIDWGQRFTLILGQRGVGKTTLLLQRMKVAKERSIYLSLDDFYFETNRLVELIESLYEEGYRAFYLDEVHRYRHWSKDLKNIYDNYADIKMVATGSSTLEVMKGQEDLSRRATVYNLPGLSFREFLHFEYGAITEAIDLGTLLKKHHELAADYYDMVDLSKAFTQYLQYGYYPFYKEGRNAYFPKLQETTNLVLETDLAAVEELQYSTLRNTRKLLYIISRTAPFKPNIAKLADKMDVSRNLILKMLDLLSRAEVINLLRSDTHGISYLQKPEKVYLQNTNLLYLLSDGKPEKGSLRETFFFNQLAVTHKVTTSSQADFMIDDTYTFEIGGPNKTREQIKGVPMAYIAADGIKGGTGNRIPLWMFGFLY